MRYLITQKNLSLREVFVVKDKNLNEDKYFAKGSLLSDGRDYRLEGTAGQAVALIKRKLFTFMPDYLISISGVPSVSVRRAASIQKAYEIVGLDWRILVDSLGCSYQVVDENGDLIMRFEKIFNGDTFELDILNPDHEIYCICLALCVQLSIKTIRRAQTK